MSRNNIAESGVTHNTDHVNAINVNAYSAQQHQGLINAVISVLQTPEQVTMVSKQYSNERNLATEVQAYAKISGKDWTYYVKGLEISIGRNTDNAASLANVDTNSGPNAIDIDLGPAKVVSRKHAVIKFNMQHGGWELLVLGRNGAKVNFKRVQVGPAAPPVLLSSGTILDVGGTQMMFILPEQEPFVSQTCVNHLIPKLVSRFGSGLESHYGSNDVNALLYDILKESDYVKRQSPHPPQQPQQQIRTFKMYGNGNNHNSEYNHGMQIDAAPRYINGDSNISPGGGMGHPDAANNNMNHNNLNASYSSSNESVSQMGFPQSLDFASDLSRDENRNVKPPHSYATMITQAILSTREGVISLADIYKYISSNYAYYRFAKTGWQNSIRHNLSLNKAFEKVPRRPNEPGKGMKWRISEDYQRDFLSKWNAGKVGKVRRGSSVARQLQLHLSKYNTLPSQVEYTPEHTVIKQQNMQQNVQQAAKVITQRDQQSQNQWHSQIESSLSVSPEAPSPVPSRQTTKAMSHQQHQQQQEPFQASHLMPPPTSASRPNQNPGNNALVSFNSASSSIASVSSSANSSSGIPRKVAPIITTTSSAPQASPAHGSLLRSPTKAFHITAMEAYTPERGSGQQSRSPVANTAEANFSDRQSKEVKNDANDATQDFPGGAKTDKSMANKSSPGVWNLLQFSSVNNTPAMLNNNDGKSMNIQSAEKAGANDNLARDLETKDVASSPLKRHHNQHGGKELILDTDGAKISIVND